MTEEINEHTHPEGEDRAAAHAAKRLADLQAEPDVEPAKAAPKPKAAKTTKPQA